MWVLARQVGMNSDQLHEMVSGHTGKNSIKALSITEGREIIEALIQIGGKIKKKRKPQRDLALNVVELISREQRLLIKHLERALGWNNNSQRLKGFAKRIIKKETISTKQEAVKIIQGMKGILKREAKGRVNNG